MAHSKSLVIEDKFDYFLHFSTIIDKMLKLKALVKETQKKLLKTIMLITPPCRTNYKVA